MRILFVTQAYKPRVNGVTFSVESFAKTLRELGHRVIIVAPNYPGYKDEETDVVRLGSHNLFISREDWVANPWLSSSRKSIEGLLSLKPDIIHTHTHFFMEMDAIWWARKVDCPIVYTYHTLFEMYAKHYVKFLPPGISIPLAKLWSTWYCRKVDMVVAPSSPLKVFLQNYHFDTRIEIVPTGIDLTKFRGHGGDEFRKRYGIARDIKILLFAGRIGKEKNIPFLFQVLKRVRKTFPNTLLLIAGDGPARSELEAQSIREGLGRPEGAAGPEGTAGPVHFLGYLEQEDLITGYDAADLFVFGSLTETQGLVIAEAMACGLPVVAVEAMGVADLMRGDRGGFLVSLELDTFTDTVLDLLKNRDLYEKKKREAVDCAGTWSIESMARRLLGFYEELIHEKGRKP
jgi:glycosyltransferase involved in cell wall biosynthesis